MILQQLKKYPSTMWALASGMAIKTTGDSLLWPLMMLYIHQSFGKPLDVAGLVLSLHFAFALIGNLLGGTLFDKWGGRQVLFTSLVFSGLLALIMAFTHDFTTFVLLLWLFGLVKGLFFPLSRVLSLVLWPGGGRDAINMIYVAENVGVAAGAFLSGWVAMLAFKWVFIGNAFTYLLTILLFPFILRNVDFTPPAKTKQAENLPTSKANWQIWAGLGVLSAAMALIITTYVQWQTTIPNYLTQLHVSLHEYGTLWTINGLMVVFAQPLVIWAIRRFSLSLKAQTLVGVLLFIATMAILSQAKVFALFALGMVVVTFGEMLIWPSVPALAAKLAPPGREGLVQGIVAGSHSTGRVFGPIVGGVLYEVLPQSWMFGVMGLLCGVAFTFFFIHREKKPLPQASQSVSA